MKFRYTAIGDTPLLIRAKKSYFQSSDVSTHFGLLSQQILYQYHKAAKAVFNHLFLFPSSSINK